MDDGFLVLQCKRGDGDGLRRIYEKYRDYLVILAVALLNDVNSAEDVVHDVFVGFAGGIGEFELAGSLKGYLATCVANRARNFRRLKRQRDVNLDEVGPAVSADRGPGEAVVCNEELKLLSEALTQVSEQQREVIALHIHGGMRFRAIAQSQGVSVNTVKSRYRYGIEKLKRILDGQVEK